MRGNIIGFDRDTNTGAISGHDGNRYDFVMLEWRAAGSPRRGDLVDFQAIEQRATEIHLIEPQYVAPGFAEFYFSPSGRISRKQYWLRFILPYSAILIPLQLVGAFSDQEGSTYQTVNVIITLVYLVCFWPSIAILVKRIHDRNKSGWYILFLFGSAIALSVMALVWLGTALYSAANGGTVTFTGSMGVAGVLTIIAAIAVLGINIWFFVEFGCLRGTIGANRFGPDPVP